MAEPDADNTLMATFSSRPQAEEAVARLRQHGVERSAIRLRDRSGHQYPGAGRTGEADENIAEELVGRGVKGGLTGTVAGAVVGLLPAFTLFENFSAGWWTMVVGAALFGGGLAVLWGFMSGFSQGAGEHGGTAARAEDVEVTVVVEVADPDERRSVSQILRAKGGR